MKERYVLQPSLTIMSKPLCPLSTIHWCPTNHVRPIVSNNVWQANYVRPIVADTSDRPLFSINCTTNNYCSTHYVQQCPTCILSNLSDNVKQTIKSGTLCATAAIIVHHFISKQTFFVHGTLRIGLLLNINHVVGFHVCLVGYTTLERKKTKLNVTVSAT